MRATDTPPNFIVFRASDNRNAFGLRGYWAYNTETGDVVSFATSTDFDKGHTLTMQEIPAMELWRSEGRVPEARRPDFVAKFIAPLVAQRQSA